MGFYVGVGVAIIVFVVLWKYQSWGTRKQLPGPSPLPIIGNLHQLLWAPPHLALLRLANKYGPLMFLRLGCIPTIVVSNAHFAKEFLQTHDLVFASRPRYAVAEHITYKCLDIMWAPYGKHWRNVRKVCALELFTTKRVDSFEHIRNEEVSSAIVSLLESAKKQESVNMRKALSDITLFSILRTAVSHGNTKTLNSITKEAKDSIEEAVQLCGQLNVSDYLVYLKWLDVQGYARKARKLHLVQDRYFQSLVDQRLLNNGNGNGDLLDVMLSLRNDDGTPQLSIDTIKAVIQDVIAAGSDTAWVTCEWAMAELVRHPSTLAKAQKELDDVVGSSRTVGESDIPNLSYLRNIVKETLRLHPASPVILYESTRACNSNGYDIPEGTRLLVNVYAIGRDEFVWENAAEFDPERFDKSSIDLRGQNFELIPFGSGRRICPGMTLGLRMVHMIMARLLHSFNWSIPHQQTVDMKERFGLAMPKLVELLLVPSPRLPLQLYTS